MMLRMGTIVESGFHDVPWTPMPVEPGGLSSAPAAAGAGGLRHGPVLSLVVVGGDEAPGAVAGGKFRGGGRLPA
jgi:hypothetical protein